MIDVAAREVSLGGTQARELRARSFWAGVSLVASGVAGLLVTLLHSWPPHEDEALALFVGRGSFPHVVHTVIAERGGAPLHFALAWVVVHAGGGLMALRVVSLLFAVASIPLIALLGARLADRSVGLVAATLAAGSWVLLFHGIYGRMYSLFLFTSTLSFVLLLDALANGGRRRFAFWGVGILAMLATHPYGVLVLAAQAVFVTLRRERRRPAVATLVVVSIAAAPFWWADVVLRGRFDVGLGGGGSRLGSPDAVARYFWWVSGDFSAGHHAWSVPVLLLAGAGFVVLAVRRWTSALLTSCVVLVPAFAFMLARLHATASPEARHLIFALPFFSTLLATALVEIARFRARLTAPVALAAVLVLLVGELRWAHLKTPALFDGDPPAEVQARADASAWLASNARRDDVLLGYEPLYLVAWERNPAFSKQVLPRADPALLASALRRLPMPVGHGIWVLDASDTTNARRRRTIEYALPHPARLFDARAFGPYLVVRTRSAVGTRERYISAAEAVMRLGRRLAIGDADVNLHTMLLAARRIYGASSSRSRSFSTISR